MKVLRLFYINMIINYKEANFKFPFEALIYTLF